MPGSFAFSLGLVVVLNMLSCRHIIPGLEGQAGCSTFFEDVRVMK